VNTDINKIWIYTFTLRNWLIRLWIAAKSEICRAGYRLETQGRVDVAVQVQRPVCWPNSLFKGDESFSIKTFN